MPRPTWKTVRRVWIITGLIVTVLFNGYMLFGRRATGFDKRVLRSDDRVAIEKSGDYIRFTPRHAVKTSALMFFPGSAVDPDAYAPLCRAIAEIGHEAVIVKMPFRWALFEYQRVETMRRGAALITDRSRRWVVSGHSLGGAMAVRFAHEHPALTSGLVLLGTTHPRDHNLSSAAYPAAKLFGTNDRIAPIEKVEAGRGRLPPHTRWIRIEGGTHAQFGYYANQPGDGKPGISHERQQAMILEAIAVILRRVDAEGSPASGGPSPSPALRMTRGRLQSPPA